MNWTLNDLDKKKADGKIIDFKMTTEKFVVPAIGGRKIGKHFKRKSAGLDFIAKNLFFWCQAKGLVLEEEYRFDKIRKWRFDFAVPDLMIAVEFNGGVYDRNGSHTSIEKIKKDNEKLNAASVQGWKVLRFTAVDYKDLLTELNKIV